MLALVVGGCGTSADPAAPVLAGPIEAAAASTGTWATAVPLPDDLWDASVVTLGDGGALIVSQDAKRAYRWRPGLTAWSKTAGLATQRFDYGAIALKDGRVLVVGGVDGDRGTDTSQRWQSYSSAYIYDGATGAWTKTGLMGTARTAPSVAVLRDGRVLVAGGSYIDGVPMPPSAAVRRDVLTAVWRGTPAQGGGSRPLTDVAAPWVGAALATAEIFDPRTGTFSATGSMKFARAGAVATTLSDGRVLVVGPGPGEVRGRYSTQMDARAYGTAEVYDPATGRWSLVGSLPPIDRKAVAKDGVPLPTTDPFATDPGKLVPLRDGGALLVGWATSWKHQADLTRTFRFDGRSGKWHQVGRAYAIGFDWDHSTYLSTGGLDTSASSVGLLPDGRVLVAGGYTSTKQKGDATTTRLARAFVPATNGWVTLPSLPKARAGGPATVLKGGSILIVGGIDSSTGSDSSIRYVPGR